MGRILVADDHDSLRRGIVRALSDAHHEVDEAPNGNVAIEKLHEGQFDVVLSDLKMGGSDGLDVLRTAKALHPSTAVILMTAFGSVHTAVEMMLTHRIGCLPTLAVHPTAALIGAFRQAHPAVAVRVIEPEDVNQVAEQVRQGRSEIGLTLTEVHFIKRSTLPKTSSGKVRRRECKRRLDELDATRPE